MTSLLLIVMVVRFVTLTKDLGGVSVIASVDIENMAMSYVGKVLKDDYAKRKSSYFEISSDVSFYSMLF